MNGRAIHESWLPRKRFPASHAMNTRRAMLRLFQLLRQLAPSRNIARRVFIAWLAGNLFLGSQLSWIEIGTVAGLDFVRS